MTELVNVYRPTNLKQLVGQPAATARITGMLRRKEIHRCILISGPSGVGKTTLARILVYLFNEVKYGTPLLDFTEETIGGGESRGIDSVRELLTMSEYAPQNKFRTILLDEVHLLTPQAIRALLKIEDGAARTIWILVTNEPERLPVTLVRRAYHIQLQIPQPTDIRRLLRRVCRREQIIFPTHAKIIRRLAYMSAGSPANALQMLQSAMDSLAANPRSSAQELLHMAVNVLESRSTDRLAAKLLIAIYLGKLVYALRVVQQSNDSVGLLNTMINFNTWLINRHTQYPGWWHPLTKQLQHYLAKIKLARTITMHGALVELRQEVISSSINEQQLLLARIGNLIVFNHTTHKENQQ